MMMWEIVVAVVVVGALAALMLTTYELKSSNADLLKRVIGLENAMDTVEKSCTISSDTIAMLDQTVISKIEVLENKLAAISKQSNLTTAQQESLRRSLLEIRQSLAHTNARSHYRPNTRGAPLA